MEEVKKALKNYQNDAYCEFEESPRDGMCEAMNVVAFFDEIKATELKDNELKNKITGRTYRPFDVAVEKVREMPRFKNDGGIYSYAKGAYFKEEIFWENVWSKWKMTKLDIGVGLAKQGVFDEWKDGK